MFLSGCTAPPNVTHSTSDAVESHKDEVAKPPILNVGGQTKWRVGDGPLMLKAGFGTEGNYTGIDGNLNVTSDMPRVFEAKVEKKDAFIYILRIAKIPENLPKDGMSVKVTFTHLATRVFCSKRIRILPK